MRTRLIFPGDIREAIRTHTANCDPEECCGLIALDRDGHIRFAYPLTNIERSGTSFTIDPEESYHAFLHADRNGWEIAGVFHSHPNGPDNLSDRDLTEVPESWIHLLASPKGLSAFRVSDGVAAEITLTNLPKA